MNVDRDYLWDKSGEPDPEIQQLEEILATLRYQPRPLEISDDLKTDQRPRSLAGLAPRLTPHFAIAATIVIALLGLGLWLSLQRLQRQQQQTVVKTVNTPAVVETAVSSPERTANERPNEVVISHAPDIRRSDPSRRHGSKATLVAANTNRSRKDSVTNPGLAIKERQEAQAAKDQLMLALRMASAKLNYAQKKTQTTNPRDGVHNQHKVG
jgi:hypothetical protein